MTSKSKISLRLGAMLAGLLSAAALAASPTAAAASADYVSASNGTDISWPQCGEPTSDFPTWTFTVVGVNGGSPFTMNPCFADEYAYMRSGFVNPSVYINLQFGVADHGYSGCAAGDLACQAHDYGYLAAQYAYTQANFVTHGDSLASVSTWYLDVETANAWNDDPGLNAQVIRGALDFLALTGKKVGVYSTPQQWSQIAGGYNPGPQIGNWVAGAESLDDDGQCANPLWPGGQVWLYQYLNLDMNLDNDHSC